VWRNEGKAGAFPSVTFSRLYKDRDGNWQDSDSFDTKDLLPLAQAAEQAWLWVGTKQDQGELPEGEPTDEPAPGE
jgi:hypothetical protein